MNEEMFHLFMKEIREINNSLVKMGSRLDNMGAEIQGIKQDTQGMKQEIQEIKQDTQGMKQEIQEIKQDNQVMKLDIKDIKIQLNRIEESQQEEVIGILREVDKKMENISYDIDYLRDQTSKHDMTIERMKKQMSRFKKRQGSCFFLFSKVPRNGGRPH